jgi:hypothetical protein
MKISINVHIDEPCVCPECKAECRRTDLREFLWDRAQNIFLVSFLCPSCKKIFAARCLDNERCRSESDTREKISETSPGLELVKLLESPEGQKDLLRQFRKAEEKDGGSECPQ